MIFFERLGILKKAFETLLPPNYSRCNFFIFNFCFWWILAKFRP